MLTRARAQASTNTFAPAVDSRSARLDERRQRAQSPGRARYDILYASAAEAEARRAAAAKAATDTAATFRPQLVRGCSSSSQQQQGARPAVASGCRAGVYNAARAQIARSSTERPRDVSRPVYDRLQV